MKGHGYNLPRGRLRPEFRADAPIVVNGGGAEEGQKKRNCRRRARMNARELLEHFNREWDELAEQGKCDTRGGMEYHRVRHLWTVQRFPLPAAAFILLHGEGR